jgi:hypothetical protein
MIESAAELKNSDKWERDSCGGLTCFWEQRRFLIFQRHNGNYGWCSSSNDSFSFSPQEYPTESEAMRKVSEAEDSKQQRPKIPGVQSREAGLLDAVRLLWDRKQPELIQCECIAAIFERVDAGQAIGDSLNEAIDRYHSPSLAAAT